ncbi:riboflavin synthase [Candidatus Woesearchaeota archaeon]|nr:riboflavin synthase [Candidatus Woesearchaeota archaeon]
MKIGVADTTFSRVDMFAFVEQAFSQVGKRIIIERYTVPGVKDLPLACKRLLQHHNCDIVMALGMVGPEPIDKQCSHEASMAIQQVQLMADRHILEVFVHMDEAKDDKDLHNLAKNRASKHALNAIELLKGKTALSPYAGTGRRQGRNDAGQVKNK